MPASLRLSRTVAVLAASALGIAPSLQAFAQDTAAPPDAQQQEQGPPPSSSGAPSGSPSGPPSGPLSGPPSGPASGPGGQAGEVANPPTRVARLATLSGTVSYHGPGEDHWQAATQNYPLSTGSAVWTEPGATASLEVSDSRIDMASTTEVDFDQLDDHTLVATQAQGETFLNLQNLLPGDTYTIRTPRGSVQIESAGQYEIASGDTQTNTTVSVLSGSAIVTAPNLSITVQPNQTATLTGTGSDSDAFHGSAGALVRDAFMQTELQNPALTGEATVTATATATANTANACPQVVQQMPGGSQLSSYGNWSNTPNYGRVWRPQVSNDWVPYRDGRWSWVEPWGWTWVDDEPWGYAPFHYGRWVYDDGWAWAPTYYEPGYAVPEAYVAPVFAPALVTFFGVGAGIGFGFGFGFGIGFGWGHPWGWGSVGWSPLGWGEPYRPWFGGGPGYFNAVNRWNVQNIHNFTYINNSVHNVTINNFNNGVRGATVVPTSAMVNSERIAGRQQAVSREELARAHPAGGAPAPTPRTAGVTRGVADRIGMPNAEAAGRAAAPGPAVNHDERGNPPLNRAGGGNAEAAGRNEPSRTEAGRTDGARNEAARNEAGQGARDAGAAQRQAGADRVTTGERAAGASPTAKDNREAGHATAANRPAGAGETAANRGAAGADHTAALGQAHAGAGGLPALRNHGEFSRQPGGAPGPAFTPHAAGQAGSGPALAQHGGESALHGNAPGVEAQGNGSALTAHAGAAQFGAQHGNLPSLRSPSEEHGPAATAARGGQPANQFGRTAAGNASANRVEPQQSHAAQAHSAPRQNYTPPEHYAEQHTPAAQHPSESHAQTPRYQAPRQQATPHYAAPQALAPRYQAPQQHYQAPQPRYQAPQPHYQAPQPHYQAPQQRFQPQQHFGGGGGGGGRRPWPP